MTRIDIQTPSEVGETARVLQLANQRRLAERQAEGWAEREAERLAERARSFVGNHASRAAKNDPWRGAVPEFDPPPGVRARIPGKRFKVAGASFKVGQDGKMRVWTASKAQSVEFDTLKLLWFEVLPAGGSRLVILFYTVAFSHDYTQEPATSGDWECLKHPPGADHNFEYCPTFISYPTPRLAANVSYQARKHAVVVSEDQINVIEGWPAGLESLISQKYTLVTGATTRTTTPVYSARYWFGFNTCMSIPNPDLGVSLVEQIAITGYNTEPEYTNTPNAYESPTLLRFGTDVEVIWVWHPMLRSYGYGYLVNRDADGQTPGWGWTPAVFSFLKNYDGEFHREDGDTSMLTRASSYEYIRNKYFPVDAPAYFLVADVVIPDAQVDTSNIYYYFRAPADATVLMYDNPNTFRTTDDTIAPVSLRPNRGKFTHELIEPTFPDAQKTIETRDSYKYKSGTIEVPITTWDWDRPMACQIELSRLGFSVDDLMLTQAEQQALADADWNTVAFKF